MTSEQEPFAYNLRGAAAASSFSKRTLSNAIRTGDLLSFKKGRRRIIFKKDLEDYLRSGGNPKGSGTGRATVETSIGV